MQDQKYQHIPKHSLFFGSFSPVHLALVESPEIFNADISDCGSDFILKSPALFLGSICRLMVYPGVVCLYMLPVPHQVAKAGTVGIFIFGNVLFAIKDFVILVDWNWIIYSTILLNQLDTEVNRNSLTSFSVSRHSDLEICLVKSNAGLNVCRETLWANLFHFYPTQIPVTKIAELGLVPSHFM